MLQTASAAHQELVLRLTAHRPHFEIDEVALPHQGTNSWVFGGVWRQQPAVFKLRLRGPGNAEAAALASLADTGLAPQLLHADGPIIMMERVAGEPWAAAAPADATAPVLLDTIGTALAALGRRGRELVVPLPPSDRRLDLAVLTGSCRRLLASNSDVYADPVFRRTLASVCSGLPEILGHQPCQFFDDPAPTNIMIADGRFARFLDLEAFWLGTTVLHAGAIVRRMVQAELRSGLPTSLTLPTLLNRTVAALGVDAGAVGTAALFCTWIQIGRYHGWNGWRTWAPGRLNGDLNEERASAEVYAAELAAIERITAGLW